MNVTDWVGTIGVFLILLAYFLNVFKKLKTTDLPFILLNLFGAAMACLASVWLNYIPFVILEAIWVIISAIGLFKYIISNLKV